LTSKFGLSSDVTKTANGSSDVSRLVGQRSHAEYAHAFFQPTVVRGSQETEFDVIDCLVGQDGVQRRVQEGAVVVVNDRELRVDRRGRRVAKDRVQPIVVKVTARSVSI